MSRKRAKRLSDEAVLAKVKEEMAEPRVAESAQLEIKRQRAAEVKEAGKA